MYVNEDEDKIKQSAINFEKLIVEYEQLVEKHFGDLMEAKNAWHGEDMEKYFETIEKEKQANLEFSGYLRQTSKALTNVSSLMNSTISANKL